MATSSGAIIPTQVTPIFAIQVDGGEAANPLLISVMHAAASDEFSFDVNRRGGLYSGVCQAGNIDKTWSSNYGY